MDIELQKAGATARAARRCELDNPFYKSENMPAATGESIEAWNAKCEAWDFGWKMEDAIRDSASR